MLARIPISPLQRVQNAAARLVVQLRPRDHVTLAMRNLYWLPMECCITYKLCLLMHCIHNGKAPPYLTDIVTATSDIEPEIGVQ